MATYDLTRSELNSLLAADHVDPTVRQSVLQYLSENGDLSGHGSRVEVQESGYPPTLDPNAEVLIVDSKSTTVQTDMSLKAIIDIADATLAVTGSNNVFVGTGPGANLVDMRGSSGDDVVVTGSGGQTVLGGQGADSIYAGSGNDSLVGGSGDFQLLQGGAGHDTLKGGSGEFDTIRGGTGVDHIQGGTGNYELIQADSGGDTIIGGSGDFDTIT